MNDDSTKSRGQKLWARIVSFFAVARPPESRPSPRTAVAASSAACAMLVSSVVCAQAAATARPGSSSADGGNELTEVVVTGTSIRGVAPTGASVIAVDREQIEAAAPRTTADLLAAIPQMAQFNAVPTGSSTFAGVVAVVSLRPNLGTGGPTLVLIDGHRVVQSGTTAGRSDVSILPPSAIARVEVIADGASAIYGSDAVGGVVNFITRRNYEGAQTSGRYSWGDSYNAYNISQTVGQRFGRGSYMFAAELQGHPNLRNIDRDYWTDVGTTAPGLNASCPIASVGASNPRCDQSRIGGNLQPNEKRTSLFASGRYSFTDTLEGWTDVVYSRARRTSEDVQPALPSTTFAATNPYNTSGVNQTVFYRPVTEFGVGLARDVTLDTMQLNGGVDIKLSHDWAGKVFGALGRSNSRSVSAGTNNVAYQRAMAATTTATAFDPFQHRTSAAVLAQMLDGTDITDVDLRLGQVAAKFDGPLFDLPSGTVRMAAGAEWRRESQVGSRRVGSPNSILQTTGTLTGYLSQGNADIARTISSGYAEFNVPLVAADRGIPLVKGVSLSLAARHDNYSDVGGTTNPKVGLDWKLFDSLRMFGSWSTAFQAPELGNQTSGAVDTRIQPQFNGGVFAPTGAGRALYAGTNGLVIAGGGANVRPQTSRNYAYGFEFTPSAWQGFRATASYYSIDFKDLLTVPGPAQGLWTNPALTSQFGILAPIVNGAIVPFTATSPEVLRFTNVLPVDGAVLPSTISWIAILQRANIQQKIQNGIDFDLSQRLEFGSHSLTARYSGTVLTKDLLAGGPGDPLVDQMPVDNTVRDVFSLDYKHGPFTAGATYSHLSDRYSTTLKTVHIAHFELVNARASYEFSASGALKGTQLSLNVENVFDRPPPVQLDAVGGRVASLNMLGRLVSVGFRKDW